MAPIASAIAAVSSGSNRSPASPTTSGSPVADEAATGSPAENASQIRQPPALEAAREDEAGGELVQPAELRAPDEAGEGDRVGEPELPDPVGDPGVELRRPARAEDADLEAVALPEQGDGLDQAEMVLVRPGLGRIEEERLGEAEPGAEARRDRRASAPGSRRTEPPGTTATFPGGRP